MKKLLTTILFVAYFIASSGATIHVHYCMGKVVEFDFSKHSSDKRCPGCGMTKNKKDCCKDKEATFKISDNHQVAISDFTIVAPVSYSENLYADDILVCYNTQPQSSVQTVNFSPHKILPLGILHCLFLI